VRAATQTRSTSDPAKIFTKGDQEKGQLSDLGRPRLAQPNGFFQFLLPMPEHHAQGGEGSENADRRSQDEKSEK